MKFWAQSFLVGVPRIVCGFRDDQGIVLDVVQYKTLEIPRQVRDKRNTWVNAQSTNTISTFYS